MIWFFYLFIYFSFDAGGQFLDGEDGFYYNPLLFGGVFSSSSSPRESGIVIRVDEDEEEEEGKK